MKTKYSLMSFFVIAVLMSINCSDDKKKNNNPVTPPVEEETLNIITDKTSISLLGVPDPIPLLIFKDGEGDLSWTLDSKPDWVEVSKTTGQVRFFPDTLKINSKIDGLEYGDYSGSIKINSNGGTAEISVTLAHHPPEIGIIQTLFNFDRYFYEEKLVITNTGGNELLWQIESQPEWITVSNSSGRITYNPNEIFVRVDFGKIDYGEYTEDLKITSNGGNHEIVIYLSYQRMLEVFPGVGAARISLGDSYDYIKKFYGTYEGNSYVELPDKRLKHTIYYYSVGLEFDFITNSPVLYGTGDNIYIRLLPPYDGLTEQSIGIGSTVDEVITTYGQPDNEDTDQHLLLYNTGIAFKYNNTKTEVTGMHIFPPPEGE
ncbi:hypothetical protein JXQ31_00465 [candidate division KSB1 bacterium]|nr:hypothetical protein [candidate division KSB1 bacterium]